MGRFLNLGWRSWWTLPGAITALACSVALAGEGARVALRYHRTAVMDQGEWWRLISGHLAHLSTTHLLLNLLGLWLLAWLFAAVSRRVLLVSMAGALVGMAIGFLIWEPHLAWYVGLSGLLHGMFAGALLAHSKTQGFEATLMGLGLVAKLVWETLYGPLPMTAEASGGPVVVAAHLYGALGGFIAGTGITMLRTRRAN